MAEGYHLRLNSIYLKWVSAVFVKSDKSKENTANFAKCSTDNEKVDFVSDLLDNNPISDEALFSGCVSKSNDASKTAREEGNKHYRDKMWHAAMKCFSKSVAYAENDSLALAMALGHRGSCSLQEGFIADALVDFSRALDIPNLKDSYRAKLISRRDVGIARMGETKERQHAWDTLPEIKSKSEYFENCSSKIQMNRNEEFGRFLEATEDIKTGEVLIVEKPFAVISKPRTLFSYCAHCFSPSRVLMGCPNCVTAMYCSTECLEKQKKVHQFECPMLGHLLDFLEFNQLLAIRMLIIGCLGETPINTLTAEEPVDEMYRSSDIRRAFNLATGNRSLKFLQGECFCTAVAVKALRKFTKFFEEFPVTESEARGFVFHCALRSAANAHQVTYFPHDESLDEVIGTAIYPTISLINHSCRSNVIRDCLGEFCILHATRPIRKGQQIFDRYCKKGYWNSDKRQRQNQLMVSYGFQCKCEACVGNWKFPQEVPYRYQSRHLPPADSILFQKRAEQFEAEFMSKCMYDIRLTEEELERCCKFLDYLYGLEIELPSWIHTFCQMQIEGALPFHIHFNRS